MPLLPIHDNANGELTHTRNTLWQACAGVALDDSVGVPIGFDMTDVVAVSELV
jgi:hypothetical protein